MDGPLRLAAEYTREKEREISKVLTSVRKTLSASSRDFNAR